MVSTSWILIEPAPVVKLGCAGLGFPPPSVSEVEKLPYIAYTNPTPSDLSRGIRARGRFGYWSRESSILLFSKGPEALLLTFDPWQVDAGVFVDPNAIPDDPEGALLKRSRTGDQLALSLSLQVHYTHVHDGPQVGEGLHHRHVRP